MTVSDKFLLYQTVSDSIWYHLILYDSIWQYLALLDSFWRYLIVSDVISTHMSDSLHYIFHFQVWSPPTSPKRSAWTLHKKVRISQKLPGSFVSGFSNCLFVCHKRIVTAGEHTIKIIIIKRFLYAVPTKIDLWKYQKDTLEDFIYKYKICLKYLLTRLSSWAVMFCWKN